MPASVYLTVLCPAKLIIIYGICPRVQMFDFAFIFNTISQNSLCTILLILFTRRKFLLLQCKFYQSLFKFVPFMLQILIGRTGTPRSAHNSKKNEGTRLKWDPVRNSCRQRVCHSNQTTWGNLVLIFQRCCHGF